MNNMDKKSPDLTCGHCGYHAPMSIKAEWSMDHDKWIWTEYKILLCTKCKKVNLLEHFSPGEEHEYPPKIIYPAVGIVQFMTILPENIKDAFYAAVKARWIDKNLYAMALGRVLDLIGLDQGITSSDFKQLAKKLYVDNKITLPLKELIDSFREIRNVGTHYNLDFLTPEEISVMTETIMELLNEIYGRPDLIKKAQETSKKAIEEKTEIKRDINEK